MDLSLFLFYQIFFGIPLAAVIWFVVSLVRFIKTPKEDDKKRYARKLLMIQSAVVAGILVLALVGVIVTLMTAVYYM